MNVAFRVVHEGLDRDDPCRSWGRLVDALATRVESGPPMAAESVAGAVRSAGLSGSATGWSDSLRALGVLDESGRLDLARASEVGTVLEIVGDSFAVSRPGPTWATVATMPTEVGTLRRPPAFRQTAGVFLGLIDRSMHNLTLAAPFVDDAAIEFLRHSVVAAIRRGVKVDVLTSPGRGDRFRPLFDDAVREPGSQLKVIELETAISSLGSHAKVLLVDATEAYVGSANLTTAGLGRHVEIGVELCGPQVADLARLFEALGRLGRAVFDVVDGRLRG